MFAGQETESIYTEIKRPGKPDPVRLASDLAWNFFTNLGLRTPYQFAVCVAIPDCAEPGTPGVLARE